jgi:small subunit ribosomal protein S9
MAAEKLYYATGRRKTSAARVYLKPGSGKFTVNGHELKVALPTSIHQVIVKQPLAETSTQGKLDIKIYVMGGGHAGQAGAIRHGISRALTLFNPEFRGVLKKAGFLTRDPRMVERKKYGMSGARKRYQYSKR